MRPLTLFLIAEGVLIMAIGGTVVAVMVGDLVVRTVKRKVGR
jgi:hypothetical protein